MKNRTGYILWVLLAGFLLMIILPVTCSAQITKHNYTINPHLSTSYQYAHATKYEQAARVIGLFTFSILTDAAADAYRDMGSEYKPLSHGLEAVSAGLLLVSPFFFQPDTKQWGWYIASYILLRMAIFDLAYNSVRGLPWNFHGTTSNWDKVIGKLNPPAGAELFGRTLIFTVGIAMPIQNIR